MWRKSNSESLVLYYYRGFIFIFRYLILNIFNPFSIFNNSVYINSQNVLGLKNNLDFNYYLLKNKWNFLKNSSFFWMLDYLFLKLLGANYLLSNKVNLGIRIKSRLKQVKWNFYSDIFNSKNSRETISILSTSFLSGIR